MWWVARCKSPGCMGILLLQRLPHNRSPEDPPKCLPEDEFCPDWIDRCGACGQRHLYSKPNVFSVRTGPSDPGAGSPAFRRARAAARSRSRTPHVGDCVLVHGLAGAFTVIAVRTGPNVVDLQGLGPPPLTQRDVEWRLLTYLDEQPEATS